ncbi:MAG TPA: DUF1049 domain-containing protein [Candidatus Tetragenococcus pullicola]|nr:DUF1049 domain-containing protein [Candidatus Tetragenococcus pullicola]
MKNQWRIVAGLILTLLIVIFAVLNNSPVSINFAFTKVTIPLIVVIIGAAFIGAIIVSLVSTGTLWQQKRENKKLMQQVNELQSTMNEQVEAKRAALDREFNNKLAEVRANSTASSNEETKTTTSSDSLSEK